MNGEAPSGADRIPTNGAPHAPSAAGPARPDDAPHVLSASRYLAWLYSPASQQPVFAKLCEIESEIAGSLRPGIDHHVAHARLQWWREECERCAQGRPVHPLTRELVKAYGAVPGEQPSPLAGISGFVDTAVWDLAGATFETRKELTAYCASMGGCDAFETAAGQGAAGAAANTGAQYGGELRGWRGGERRNELPDGAAASARRTPGLACRQARRRTPRDRRAASAATNSGLACRQARQRTPGSARQRVWRRTRGRARRQVRQLTRALVWRRTRQQAIRRRVCLVRARVGGCWARRCVRLRCWQSWRVRLMSDGCAFLWMSWNGWASM